jgi:ribonuclease HI
VARNNSGQVIFAACCPITKCQDAEEAEARAALKGINLLQGLGHDRIILELDCATAVTAIRSKEPDRSKLWPIYDETKENLKNLGDFVVHHVKKERESNTVADALAKLARSAGSCFWTSQSPDLVHDLVTHDTPVNFDAFII